MSAAYKGLGAAVGAVVFLIGLAMIFGALPSSIACSPGVTDCSQEYVVSSFTVTSSGLAASLHDASCVVENGARACPLVSSVSVAWGDGARSNGSVGGTLAHSYAAAGTYRVTETAYAKNATGATLSGTSSQSLTVSSSGSGSGTASYTLDPLLAWTQVGLSVTVRDTSEVANVTGYSDAIAWGDGARTTLNATGATASHTYTLPANASSATFMLTQTDTAASPTGSRVEVSAVYTLTVSGNSTGSSGGGCSATNTCPPAPPTGSPSPYTVNAVSLAATVGGLLLVVVVVAPGDIRPRVLVLGAGVLVALLAGYEAGGW